MSSHQIPDSQTAADLPMVVHLLGNEDFIDQFEVDADKAMDFLGIKRSRLTQISGRELRVGRIRRDRYLRPVYRVKDLEDYKAWTRATATSQNSSKAMEQAVDRLGQQWTEFKLDSQQYMEDVLRTSIKSILEQVHVLRQSQVKDLKQLTRMQQQALEFSERSFCLLEEELSALAQKVERGETANAKNLALLKTISEGLHLDVRQLVQAVKHLEDKQSEQQQAIQEEQAQILAELQAAKEWMRQVSAEQAESQRRSSEILEELKNIKSQLKGRARDSQEESRRPPSLGSLHRRKRKGASASRPMSTSFS